MHQQFDADLDAALAAAFPDREVAAVDGTGPSWNEQNRTVRATFADGDRAFVKVAADGDGSRVARERAAVAYVDANCDVRVPEVLACDPDANVPYLATAPLDDGTVVDAWREWSAAEREAHCRRLGRTLAALHEQSFDRHGQIRGGDADGLDLDTGTWTDVLRERVAFMRSVAPAERFPHHFDAVLDAIEANRDLLDGAPAVLVHGDPAHPNAVPGDPVGLIDWEVAHVGDPVRELHRARDQHVPDEHAESLTAALHDGYRAVAGGLPAGFAERTPVYDAVRYLGTTGFYEKYVEFADESPEELAAEMAAEMERRLDRIR